MTESPARKQWGPSRGHLEEPPPHPCLWAGEQGSNSISFLITQKWYWAPRDRPPNGPADKKLTILARSLSKTNHSLLVYYGRDLSVIANKWQLSVLYCSNGNGQNGEFL